VLLEMVRDPFAHPRLEAIEAGQWSSVKTMRVFNVCAGPQLPAVLEMPSHHQARGLTAPPLTTQRQEVGWAPFRPKTQAADELRRNPFPPVLNRDKSSADIGRPTIYP